VDCEDGEEDLMGVGRNEDPFVVEVFFKDDFNVKRPPDDEVVDNMDEVDDDEGCLGVMVGFVSPGRVARPDAIC